MKEKYEKSNANSKILAVIAILFLSIIIFSFLYSLIILIIQPSNIFVVENGKIYKEESTVGYIIREEKVLTGENYKNGLVEIKKEGQKVAKGDNVFRYYSNNEANLIDSISKLDVEIQEALEGQTDVYSADIQLLDKQIEEYLGKILITNNIEEKKEYKSNISDLLIKKAKIAGELSPSGSYISSLIEKRRKLEEELNNGQEYIKAEISGVVSYKVDGLEDVLNPNNYENINENMISNYNLKTGQMIVANREAGKIVNNCECSIAVFLESEEAKNAQVGDKSVMLRLSDATEINSEIEYIAEQENGKTMIVFKINKKVENLISYRKISLDVIWWSYSGLKVSNEAIIKEDNLNYVIRNRTGYKDKILVKVLKQNDSYSIIENYTTDELFGLGYKKEEISTMKSIGLYDEISLQKNV